MTFFKSLVRLDWVSDSDLPRTKRALYELATYAVTAQSGEIKITNDKAETKKGMVKICCLLNPPQDIPCTDEVK